MTWIQTASGRRFDLANPRAEDVDFDTDVPDALARLARFTGHINAGPYSVAQHSVHCCDVVYGETGDPVAAAYALLHDGKEYAFGDDATPKKWAIRAVARQVAGSEGETLISAVFQTFERRIDDAIHAAAGLPMPSPRTIEIVKDIDFRMLHAERKQLLDGAGHPRHRWFYDNGKPPKAVGLVLKVMPWVQAADQFRERFRRIVPEARAALAKRGAA